MKLNEFKMFAILKIFRLLGEENQNNSFKLFFFSCFQAFWNPMLPWWRTVMQGLHKTAESHDSDSNCSPERLREINLRPGDENK